MNETQDHHADAGASRDVFRIASLPGLDAERPNIPYLELFYLALRKHGIVQTAEFHPTAKWITANARNVDAIHIHWPEQIWNQEAGSFPMFLERLPGYYRWRKITALPRNVIGLEKARRVLRLARDHGIKVIWTVHELEPHRGSGGVHRKGYEIMAQHTDLAICHSRSCFEEFRARHACCGSAIIMRHGNFRELYPAPRDRDTVLDELRLDSHLPVVAMLGAIRKYKGASLAIDAVRRLSGRVQFILAGKPDQDSNVASVERQLSEISNCRLIARRLSSQEMADLAHCTDCLLLPYTQITTSGVLHLAHTFDCGVVANRLPYFEEYMENYPHLGVLSTAATPERFAEAIEECLRIPRDLRVASCRALTNDTEWDTVIQPVVDAIDQWRAR